MSARDDFDLMKRAVMFDADTDERCGFKDDAEETRKAFNRLFTPRPLRELVAEGFTRFMMNDNYCTISALNKDRVLFQYYECDLSRIANELARPILTPEDMGA